jgi:hypothetical protein
MASKATDTSKTGYKDARPAAPPAAPRYTGEDRRSGGNNGGSGRRS